MKKSVLVIGSGGREHALAWKLSQSPQVGRVIVAPGNDGYSPKWERWPADLSLGREEFKRLALKVREAAVDLTVVGPDNALADGIVDVFSEHGLLIFGPTAAAARIESSKAFAKEVMKAARVPTARFQVVKSAAEAENFLRAVEWGSGWVIKADGLALGKGVRVCATREEALEAASHLIAVSGSLVIEERLQGQEISWLAFCDGENCALLEPARDFKRIRDGDQGPNTGGMGAFSPVPLGSQGRILAERIRKEVFLPTLQELKKRGAFFRGVLYAGLMVDFKAGTFAVLEFNARFGDPETQALLPRMSGDLYAWCEAVARGELSVMPKNLPFSDQKSVFVVAAAQGYPDAPKKGAAIVSRLANFSDACAPEFFMAGVSRMSPDQWVTSGGRVLGALGMGETFAAARKKAYERLSQIEFFGMQFRSDIASGVDS